MVNPLHTDLPADGVGTDDFEAAQSFEILAELMGSDSDSVDLDTLFEAVLAVTDEAEVVDTHAGMDSPAFTAAGESPMAQSQIVDTGSIDDVLNSLTDANGPDLSDFGSHGAIDPFNPDT